jgi:hypothetical protein
MSYKQEIIEEFYTDLNYYYIRINNVDRCKANELNAYLLDSAFDTLTTEFNIDVKKNNKVLFQIPYVDGPSYFVITGSQYNILGSFVDPVLSKFFYPIGGSGGDGQPTKLVSLDPRTVIGGSGYNLTIDTSAIIGGDSDLDGLITFVYTELLVRAYIKGDTTGKYYVYIDNKSTGEVVLTTHSAYNTDVDVTQYGVSILPEIKDNTSAIITTEDIGIGDTVDYSLVKKLVDYTDVGTGGSVDSVTSDNGGIEVDNVDPANPKVGAVVSSDPDNALSLHPNGLFATGGSGINSVGSDNSGIEVDNDDPANPKVGAVVSSVAQNALSLQPDGLYAATGSGGQPTTLTSEDSRTIVTGSGTYDVHINTSAITGIDNVLPIENDAALPSNANQNLLYVTNDLGKIWQYLGASWRQLNLGGSGGSDFDKVVSALLANNDAKVTLMGDTTLTYDMIVNTITVLGEYDETLNKTSYNYDFEDEQTGYHVAIVNHGVTNPENALKAWEYDVEDAIINVDNETLELYDNGKDNPYYRVRISGNAGNALTVDNLGLFVSSTGGSGLDNLIDMNYWENTILTLIKGDTTDIYYLYLVNKGYYTVEDIIESGYDPDQNITTYHHTLLEHVPNTMIVLTTENIAVGATIDLTLMLKRREYVAVDIPDFDILREYDLYQGGYRVILRGNTIGKYTTFTANEADVNGNYSPVTDTTAYVKNFDNPKSMFTVEIRDIENVTVKLFEFFDTVISIATDADLPEFDFRDDVLYITDDYHKIWKFIGDSFVQLNAGGGTGSVNSVSSDNAGIEVDNVDPANPKVGTVISSDPNNALSLHNNGLFAGAGTANDFDRVLSIKLLFNGFELLLNGNTTTEYIVTIKAVGGETIVDGHYEGADVTSYAYVIPTPYSGSFSGKNYYGVTIYDLEGNIAYKRYNYYLPDSFDNVIRSTYTSDHAVVELKYDTIGVYNVGLIKYNSDSDIKCIDICTGTFNDTENISSYENTTSASLLGADYLIITKEVLVIGSQVDFNLIFKSVARESGGSGGSDFDKLIGYDYQENGDIYAYLKGRTDDSYALVALNSQEVITDVTYGMFNSTRNYTLYNFLSDTVKISDMLAFTDETGLVVGGELDYTYVVKLFDLNNNSKMVKESLTNQIDGTTNTFTIDTPINGLVMVYYNGQLQDDSDYRIVDQLLTFYSLVPTVGSKLVVFVGTDGSGGGSDLNISSETIQLKVNQTGNNVVLNADTMKGVNWVNQKAFIWTSAIPDVIDKDNVDSFDADILINHSGIDSPGFAVQFINQENDGYRLAFWWEMEFEGMSSDIVPYGTIFYEANTGLLKTLLTKTDTDWTIIRPNPIDSGSDYTTDQFLALYDAAASNVTAIKDADNNLTLNAPSSGGNVLNLFDLYIIEVGDLLGTIYWNTSHNPEPFNISITFLDLVGTGTYTLGKRDTDLGVVIGMCDGLPDNFNPADMDIPIYMNSNWVTSDSSLYNVFYDGTNHKLLFKNKSLVYEVSDSKWDIAAADWSPYGVYIEVPDLDKFYRYHVDSAGYPSIYLSTDTVGRYYMIAVRADNYILYSTPGEYSAGTEKTTYGSVPTQDLATLDKLIITTQPDGAGFNFNEALALKYIDYKPGGGSGGATWGSITGSIGEQTDLMDIFNYKADVENINYTNDVTGQATLNNNGAEVSCPLSITSNAITNDKILDGAINTSKIANGAVNANKIADGAVTGDKIANKTITYNKIVAAPSLGQVLTSSTAANAIWSNPLMIGGQITPPQENVDSWIYWVFPRDWSGELNFNCQIIKSNNAVAHTFISYKHQITTSYGDNNSLVKAVAINEILQGSSTLIITPLSAWTDEENTYIGIKLNMAGGRGHYIMEWSTISNFVRTLPYCVTYIDYHTPGTELDTDPTTLPQVITWESEPSPYIDLSQISVGQSIQEIVLLDPTVNTAVSQLVIHSEGMFSDPMSFTLDVSFDKGFNTVRISTSGTSNDFSNLIVYYGPQSIWNPDLIDNDYVHYDNDTHTFTIKDMFNSVQSVVSFTSGFGEYLLMTLGDENKELKND